eukprot:1047991-Rhodomonas_salina.2
MAGVSTGHRVANTCDGRRMVAHPSSSIRKLLSFCRAVVQFDLPGTTRRTLRQYGRLRRLIADFVKNISRSIRDCE